MGGHLNRCYPAIRLANDYLIFAQTFDILLASASEPDNGEPIMVEQTNLAVIQKIEQAGLPDNDQWTNRFEIHSETSNRIYIIAQHKTKRHFACSCPAWRTRRKCKHLETLGLPCFEKPHEIKRVAR